MNIDRHLILCIVILAFAFSTNIWGTSIYMYDEAKNSQCAREMLASESLFVPIFNGELRTDKPPLHYIFMILAYQMFGFSAFSARVFSVIFGIITVLGTYLTARTHLGKKAALVAAISLTCSIQLATQFHLATPDPYLICLVGLALMSFFNGYRYGKYKWYLLAYVFIALATLAKGPVAILLPGLVVLLFLLFEGKLNIKTILALRPITGIFIILVIAGPWFLMAHIQTEGAWSEGFFLKHNLQRYAEPMEGHGAPFFMSLVYVFTGLLPFSMLLPQSLFFGFKKRRENKLVHLSLIIVSVFVGFFAISGTILPSYTEPCLPFAALLIGYYTQENWSKFSKRISSIRISYLLILLVAFALPVATFLGLKNEDYLAHTAYIAWYLLVFPVGTLLAVILFYKSRVQASLFSLAFTFIMGTAVLHFFAYPVIDNENPVKAFLPFVENDVPTVYYRQINPAFIIPLDAPIKKLDSISELQAYMKKEKRFYLLSRKKYQEELDGIIDLHFVTSKRELFEKNEAVLYEYKHSK